MSKIKVTKIKLSQVMGLEQLEITPGNIVRIKGQNGLGKTSVVKALITAFQGGNPVEIIRQGSESAEIAIEFDDNSSIVKTVKAKGSANVSVTGPDGKKVTKAPMSFINDRIDLNSLNPVSIITADRKNRIRLLLDSIPMKAEREDFRKVFNGYVDHETFPVQALEGHALEAIDYFFKLIYDKRTDINSRLKQAEASLKDLQDMSYEIELSDVEKHIKDTEAERDKKLNELDRKIADIQASQEKMLADLESSYLAGLEKIRQMEREATEAYQNAKSAIIAQAGIDKNEIFNQKTNIIAPYAEEITKLREIEKRQAAIEESKKIIARNQEQVNKLKTDSEKQTEYLSKLESMKSDYLKQIPIPGLEVKDGEIYYNGIPFDSLNSQSQIDIVAEIAKLRAGDIGLIVVDGFERLDTEHQKAFIDTFSKTDLQLIVTEVSDDKELTIVNG